MDITTNDDDFDVFFQSNCTRICYWTKKEKVITCKIFRKKNTTEYFFSQIMFVELVYNAIKRR